MGDSLPPPLIFLLIVGDKLSSILILLVLPIKVLCCWLGHRLLEECLYLFEALKNIETNDPLLVSNGLY